MKVNTENNDTLLSNIIFTDDQRNEDLTLDLYLPTDKGDHTACIIVVQGGAFFPQTGDGVRSYAEYLCEHGFAVALIGYRGQPTHKSMETLADIKASIRYVRRNASKYNIDISRLAILGRSAGACLSMLAATTADIPDYEGDRGNSSESTQVYAVVAIAGIYDFIARFNDPEHRDLHQDVIAKQASNSGWFKTPYSIDNSEWIQVSAKFQLHKQTPPTLLIHSKDDHVVPWVQSRDLYKKMKKMELSPQLFKKI